MVEGGRMKSELKYNPETGEPLIDGYPLYSGLPNGEKHTVEENEHGYCPNCGMDFDGGLIWETGLEMHGTEEEADRYAKAYGATRTTGRWGKRIGLYDMERDMTTHWKCPDCGHEWPRST